MSKRRYHEYYGRLYDQLELILCRRLLVTPKYKVGTNINCFNRKQRLIIEKSINVFCKLTLFHTILSLGTYIFNLISYFQPEYFSKNRTCVCIHI